MIASLLLLAETLLQDRLGPWAASLHKAAFAALAWAWLSPPLFFGLRKLRERRRAPRVAYWACACGQANPPSAPFCSKCAAPLPRDLIERMADAPVGRALGKASVFVGKALRGAGWALYYLIPAGALFFLDAHRWGGGPLRELFAGAGLLAAVCVAVLLNRAAARDAGLLSRGVMLISAAAMGGGVLLCGILWAAAPYPPSKPLASVRLLPDGRVALEMPDGRRLDRRGALQESAVEFRVKSAFVSWPLLGVRQTIPLAVGNEPLLDERSTRFWEAGARRWRTDQPHKPRVALREDTLFAPPGGPYLLREAIDGAGLVLVNVDEQR